MTLMAAGILGLVISQIVREDKIDFEEIVDFWGFELIQVWDWAEQWESDQSLQWQ